MAGKKQTKSKLNHTLTTIANLLNKHNITDWFIAYGTLLGIIRENSCIHGDDDVDIICNINDYDNIKQILTQNGFKFYKKLSKYDIENNQNFYKTKSTRNHSSVDFYMAKIDNKGNFYDTWEETTWSKCYCYKKLVKYKWNDTILYLPKNYEKKIANIYGNDWNIPQDTKGPPLRKKIL